MEQPTDVLVLLPALYMVLISLFLSFSLLFIFFFVHFLSLLLYFFLHIGLLFDVTISNMLGLCQCIPGWYGASCNSNSPNPTRMITLSPSPFCLLSYRISPLPIPSSLSYVSYSIPLYSGSYDLSSYPQRYCSSHFCSGCSDNVRPSLPLPISPLLIFFTLLFSLKIR